MALPTSGSLSIKNAAGNDRSIAYCIDGNITGNKSLSTLGATANKTAPQCIREFYNYSEVPVCVCTYYTYGTDDLSSVVYKRICFTPNPIVGDSYILTLKTLMLTASQAAGSCAYVCVTCNGSSVLYCCIPAGVGITTFCYNRAIGSSTTLCVLMYARAANTACSNYSYVYTCMESLTCNNGAKQYTRGTPYCQQARTG